jgi:hypothetical protein
MEKGTLVQDIGEFALLERLTAVLGSVGLGAGQGVIRGIGDDAAVLQPTPGTRLLATSDMLIEGIHFDLSYISPRVSFKYWGGKTTGAGKRGSYSVKQTKFGNGGQGPRSKF